MEYNHVIVNGQPIIDLRNDTVTSDTLLQGVTAHNGAGESITGSIIGTNIAGTIFSYAGTTPPQGFLWCHGQAVSRISYSELFTAIGTKYGAGDGTTTFNLPNISIQSAPELIWENKDTSSSFAAQTVNVNGTDCDFYLIEFAENTGAADELIICSMITKVGTSGGLLKMGNERQVRNFSSTASSVIFQVGQAANYNVALATNNAKAIPVRIYGIKAGTYTESIICTGSIATNTTEYSSDTTLNGVLTPNPAFYAPIDSGTPGYILEATESGVPQWIYNRSIKAGIMLRNPAATNLSTGSARLAFSTIASSYNIDGYLAYDASYGGVKVFKTGKYLLWGSVVITNAKAGDQLQANYCKKSGETNTVGYSQFIRAQGNTNTSVPYLPIILGLQENDLVSLAAANGTATRGTASATENSHLVVLYLGA